MSLWLEAAFRELGLPKEWLFKFDLCAGEAVTNIISYAYPDDDTHEISLRLSFAGSLVNLEIEDDGIPFNPLDTPERIHPTNLEEAKIGGLGIELILRHMDECNYIRRNGRNVLKMSTIIPQAADIEPQPL